MYNNNGIKHKKEKLGKHYYKDIKIKMRKYNNI